MKINIKVVRPDLVPEIWDMVFTHLKPAVEEDLFHDEASIKKALIEDRALMFLALVDGVIKGVVVANIEEGKHHFVSIISLGGVDMKDWQDAMLGALDKYASGMKCRYIISTGTKAWGRILKDYKAGKTLYYKEVA